jgi:hypothetical protein
LISARSISQPASWRSSLLSAVNSIGKAGYRLCCLRSQSGR